MKYVKAIGTLYTSVNAFCSHRPDQNIDYSEPSGRVLCLFLVGIHLPSQQNELFPLLSSLVD